MTAPMLVPLTVAIPMATAALLIAVAHVILPRLADIRLHEPQHGR